MTEPGATPEPAPSPGAAPAPRAPRGATAAPLALAALLFVASLPLSAYQGRASSGEVDFPGFFLLVMGAMGFLFGHWGWYANLLLPVSAVLALVCRRATLVAATVTGVIGLAFAASSYVTLSTFSMIGNNEGEMATFVAFGPAIHLWVACHALTLAAPIVGLVRLRRG